jgi:hypothetical protein
LFPSSAVGKSQPQVVWIHFCMERNHDPITILWLSLVHYFSRPVFGVERSIVEERMRFGLRPKDGESMSSLRWSPAMGWA